MEWLEDNAWAAWLGLALALGAVEAATADFIFVMMALGATAGAATAAAGAGFPVQVVVAVVTAVALIGIVRPILKRRLAASNTHVALGTQGYVGRSAEVLREVTSDGGLVRIGGEEWTARAASGSLPMPAGMRAKVVSIDGATAVVAPLAREPRPDAIGE